MALSGREKAALVVLALEEDVAKNLLSRLAEEDLVALAKCVEALEPVPTEEVKPAMTEFVEQLNAPFVFGKSGEYMRHLATAALGEDRARQLFLAPAPVQEVGGPASVLRGARVSTLASLLRDEHPQLAAMILSQLTTSQASGVLAEMPEDFRVELIARIAEMKELSEDAVEAASNALIEALEAAGGLSSPSAGNMFDGTEFVAGILNEMSSEIGDELLETLEERSAETAAKLREAMFVFEDLGLMDVRSLQTLMREISADQMVLALRAAGESLREKFFAAVSSRAAETMREDLELMPPQRLSDVEQVQRQIIDAALALAADGRITMPGRGNEDLV